MPFALFDTVNGSTSFPPFNITSMSQSEIAENPPRCFYFLQGVRRAAGSDPLRQGSL